MSRESVLNANMTADRIRAGVLTSPIIVLTKPRKNKGPKMYQSYFGDTIYGNNYIENPCKRFFGVYYGEEGAKDFLKASRSWHG